MPLHDPAAIPLILILLFILTQRSLCVWDRKVEKLALAGLILSYLAAIVLQLTLHHAPYTRWTTRLLLLTFIAAILRRTITHLSPLRKTIIIILLAAATLLTLIPPPFLHFP